MRRILDYTTDLAIIVAAACLVTLLYLRLRPVSLAAGGTQIIRTGEHFPVSFSSANPKGFLVLALQMGCHFCEESMPFYRRLSDEVVRTGIGIIYVLPGALEESRGYLRTRGLLGGQVLQRQLRDVRVYGTPTLVLVDGGGTVKGVWVGKLNPMRERQVEDAVRNMLQP